MEAIVNLCHAIENTANPPEDRIAVLYSVYTSNIPIMRRTYVEWIVSALYFLWHAGQLFSWYAHSPKALKK